MPTACFRQRVLATQTRIGENWKQTFDANTEILEAALGNALSYSRLNDSTMNSATSDGV